MKSFSDRELDRISQVFESSSITKQPVHLQSLNCSGHVVSSKSLHRFGAAIASLCKNIKISNFTTLAIGDVTMGDVGVQAFVAGLLSQEMILQIVQSATSPETIQRLFGLSYQMANLIILAQQKDTKFFKMAKERLPNALLIQNLPKHWSMNASKVSTVRDVQSSQHVQQQQQQHPQQKEEYGYSYRKKKSE